MKLLLEFGQTACPSSSKKAGAGRALKEALKGLNLKIDRRIAVGVVIDNRPYSRLTLNFADNQILSLKPSPEWRRPYRR